MEDAVTQSILEKFLVLGPILDERAKRLWAAAEARSLGRPRQPEGGQFQRRGDPVVSVDTKKKELVGTSATAAGSGGRRASRRRCWSTTQGRGAGQGDPVRRLRLGGEQRRVSVGVDHDTATFAAETLRRWWLRMARATHPDARRLLVTADADGSNGHRNRLRKLSCGASRTRRAWRSPCATSRGNQQMEQDRTPHVLLDHRELARAPGGQPRGGGGTDRQHDHQGGPVDQGGTGRQPLPHRRQGERRRTGWRAHPTLPLPRRLEPSDLGAKGDGAAALAGRGLRQFKPCASAQAAKCAARFTTQVRKLS